MKALVRCPDGSRHVLLTELREPGSPRHGEVLVRMCLAPINPADRLVIAGRYAASVGVPDIIGAEGMGVVEVVGSGVDSLVAGDRVILLSRGNWVERRCVPAAELLKVPDALPDMQAAMLRINPATAARLLDRLSLAPGETLIQNAAGSSVARWVRRLVARRGLHVIDVMREPHRPGALPDGPDLVARVEALTGGRPVGGALDAVAGEATGRLASCLAPQGRLLVFGHLSGEPCSIPSLLLTTRSLSVQGFTLRLDEARPGRAPDAAFYDELAMIAAADPEPVAAIFPLEAIGDALAQESGPGGRILLSC